MSLLETYQGCKTLLAQKLGLKGVEASETEGLTSLIEKIDNISTSGGGNSISPIPTFFTEPDFIVGSETYIGGTKSFSGKLNAGSADNIDINGLEGATVLIKIDNKIVGRGQTSSDGSFNISVLFTEANEDDDVYFVFEGTEHFAPSQVLGDWVQVYNEKIEIIPEKNYVRSSDSIDITITTGVFGQMTNTLKLYKTIESTKTLIGTFDPRNGPITYSYQGTGAGNVTFSAECFNLQSVENPVVDDYAPEVASITLNSNELTEGVFDIYATCLDQHNQIISNAAITFYKGNTSIGTATSNSNGIATLSSIPFPMGTYIITAESNNVTSNSLTIETLGVFDEIEITNSTPSILSNIDEDQVLIETQLLKNNVSTSIEGILVNFYNYIDSNNPILLSSSSTNQNGVASLLYNSSGLGDIKVKAKIDDVVSEPYNIIDTEDINYLLKSSNYTQINGGVPSISNNSIVLSAVKETRTTNEFINSSHYVMEFDIQYCSDNTNYRSRLNLLFKPDGYTRQKTSPIQTGGDIPGNGFKSIWIYDDYDETGSGGTNVQTVSKFNQYSNAWHHFKIIRDGQYVEIWLDGALVVQRTFNSQLYNGLYMWKWQGGDLTIKNITFNTI